MNRLWRSTSLRFTLIATALYLLSVLGLLFGIYWVQLRNIEADLDLRINDRLDALMAEYQRGGMARLEEDLRVRLRSQNLSTSYYRLLDAQGRIIVGSPADLPLHFGHYSFRIDPGKTEDGMPYRLRVRTVRLGEDGALMVGMGSAESAALEDLVEGAVLVALAGAVAIGAAIAFVLTRGLMNRLSAINEAAMQIMRGDLRGRVALLGSGDEFDRIAMKLNHMFDRIEALMSDMRHVTTNIAHDLRTPLGRLNRRLDELRAQVGADPAAVQSVDRAIAECESVIATFNAVLRIAQVESAAALSEEVDLSEVFHTIEEAYAPLAQDEGRAFLCEIEPGLWLNSDRGLLLQMLSNLIENALKHTQRGTPLRLTLRKTAEGASAAVEDRGPGIPESAREKVLEQFFRLEASRTTPGAGLGLSLVAAIARQQRIDLVLEDSAPGLRVVLRFKGVSSKPSADPVWSGGEALAAT